MLLSRLSHPFHGKSSSRRTSPSPGRPTSRGSAAPAQAAPQAAFAAVDPADSSTPASDASETKHFPPQVRIVRAPTQPHNEPDTGTKGTAVRSPQKYGPSRRARPAHSVVGDLPMDRTVHPSNPPGSPPLPVLYVHKRGGEVLEDPVSNYGAAHSMAERELLGLSPFLPHSVHTLATQVDRAWQQFQTRRRVVEAGHEADGELMQYTFLRSLKDQNAVLFYALLQSHLRETLSIIYTPVVGAAITNYSHIFRRPDGTYLTYPAYKSAIDAKSGDRQAGRKYLRDALTHFHHLGKEDIDVIICTDSEGILGIGDQGTS